MLTNTNGSTTNIINGYRSDGLRAWKQNSAGTRTYFLYDLGGRIVCELTSTGAVQAEDTFGPLGLVERSGSGNAIGLGFFGFDPSGNQVLRLTSTGSVSTSILFDSYGNSVATSGSTATYPFGFGGEFGDYTDTETGFVLCQHRFYDPIKCRWINRDPIGMEGGINLYEYGGDDPVGKYDVSGYWEDNDYRVRLPQGPEGVPFYPPQANIFDNVNAALKVNPIIVYPWYIQMVKKDAPWDYKEQGLQYDEFGNFNAGAVGAALGIPLDNITKGADIFHQVDHNGEKPSPLDHGNDWVVKGYNWFKKNYPDGKHYRPKIILCKQKGK